MQAIIASLQSKHASLERRLKSEEARPQPDADAVRRLKIAKLRIKDQLAQLWRKRRAQVRVRLTT